MSKRTQDIEKLLHWAYRDELPKGYRDGARGITPAISPMFRYAALGGPIDNWSREPGFPVAMGTQPHPDALTIHRAVMELEDVAIQWPAGAEALLGELWPYMGEEEKFLACKMRIQPAGLVTLHARMANRPIWEMPYTIVRVVGRDRKSPLRKGRGRKSARMQGELRLDPSASEILYARFEWFAWHAALCELAKLELIEQQPTPPAAPQQPWLYPDEARIFSDATAMSARALASKRLSGLAKLPLTPKRDKVLPQRPASQHGPVRHLFTKPTTLT